MYQAWRSGRHRFPNMFLSILCQRPRLLFCVLTSFHPFVSYIWDAPHFMLLSILLFSCLFSGHISCMVKFISVFEDAELAPSLSILTSLLVYRGRLGAKETIRKLNSRHIFTLFSPNLTSFSLFHKFFPTLTIFPAIFCSPNVKFSVSFLSLYKPVKKHYLEPGHSQSTKDHLCRTHSFVHKAIFVL